MRTLLLDLRQRILACYDEGKDTRNPIANGFAPLGDNPDAAIARRLLLARRSSRSLLPMRSV